MIWGDGIVGKQNLHPTNPRHGSRRARARSVLQWNLSGFDVWWLNLDPNTTWEGTLKIPLQPHFLRRYGCIYGENTNPKLPMQGGICKSRIEIPLSLTSHATSKTRQNFELVPSRKCRNCTPAFSPCAIDGIAKRYIFIHLCYCMIYIGLYRQWILYNGLFGYIYIYTSLDRSKLWPVLLGTGAPPHRFLEKEQMFTASDV